MNTSQLDSKDNQLALAEQDQDIPIKQQEYQQDNFLVDMRKQYEQAQALYKDDPNKKFGNRHPEELKAVAVALRAAGMPYEKISFVLKVGVGTVHSWVNSPEMLGGRYSQLAEKVKSQLSNRQYLLSSSILSNISDEDMKKASLKDKVLSSSILIDKARLIDGEHTENHLVYVKRAAEIKSNLDKDNERLKELSVIEANLLENKDNS